MILLLVSLLKTIIRSFLDKILDIMSLVSLLMSVRCQQKLIDVIDAFLSGRSIPTRFSSARLDGDFFSAYGPADPANRAHLPTVARSRGRICRRRRAGERVRQPQLLLSVVVDCRGGFDRQIQAESREARGQADGEGTWGTGRWQSSGQS